MLGNTKIVSNLSSVGVRVFKVRSWTLTQVKNVYSLSTGMSWKVVLSLLLSTEPALELMDDLVSGWSAPTEPGLGAFPEGKTDGCTSCG